MSEAEFYLKKLLPIFTNLLALLDASKALAYGYGFRCILFVIVFFASSLYHMCLSFWYTCFWSIGYFKLIDFWSAELSLPVMALLFIRFRSPFIEKWLIVIFVILVGILVTRTGSSFSSQAIIGGVSGLIVVVYLLWHRCAHGYWASYDLVQMTLGIGISSVGISFFVVQEWFPPYYGYNHSAWHACVFIGAYFLLGIKPPSDSIYNLEASIPAIAKPIYDAAVAINDQINRVLPLTKPVWHDDFRDGKTYYPVNSYRVLPFAMVKTK